MAKTDESFEVEGVVEQAFPGSEFLIKLTSEGFEGHEVRARLSGKMRMYYIKIVRGDKVQVKISPYNLEIGTITYRFK